MNGRSKRVLYGLCLALALGLGGVVWWLGVRDEAGTGATGPANVISPQREARPEPKTAVVVDPDGRCSEFRRPSKSVVIKRRFDAAGELETTTVYRVGKGEKALSGLVLDARGEILYRCVYGYAMPDGKLVEEQVHRADRAARMATGAEPGLTYRVLYSVGGDGQIGSEVIKVDLSEKDSEQDGVERPNGIPSAPFEIPWEEL